METYLVDSMSDDHDHTEEPEEVHEHLADPTTGELDDALNEKLENAFEQPTPQILLHDIAKIASEHDPIDLAHASTRLPASARIVVYENLPDLHAKIIFMINTGSSTRTAIFREIDDEEIRELIEHMRPDEAIELLDDMSDRRLRRVFERLNPKKAQRIRELLKHDRHSAGRLMTNEFFSFHMNTTIGEVATTIRNNAGIELTRRIFVVSDDGELAGYIPERNLIINPHYLPLRQVMRPVLHKITTDAPRDEAVDLVSRYEISALPVVDWHNRLVGVITYKDVVEAMEDIADETIATIAGTAEVVSEHDPVWKRFMWRAPWLFVTLCAGLVTSTALTHFSDRVWFAIVPFFVPLINMMSGNVGLQCSTILVRGLSTGELTPGSRRRAIMKELGIGLLIGCTFGIFCGIVVYILSHLGIQHADKSSLAMATTISFGVLGACLTATTLGALSPFMFMRLRIDPAVASGPIVTAFNDVLSTFVFFIIARTIYSLVG